MEKKKTKTKVYSEEVQKFLYSIEDYANGNVKEYNTKIVTLDCTEEDLMFSLNEGPAFRQFFNVEGNMVTVPTFFTVVEGVNNNVGEYLKIFSVCIQSENNITIESIDDLFYKETEKYGKINKIKELLQSVIDMIDFRYSSYFDERRNRFNTDALVNSRDKNFSRYPLELQRYLINKLNTFINYNIFARPLDNSEKLKLIELVSKLNNDLIEKINNFDLSKKTPKIMLFLSEDKRLTNMETLLLGYLHSLGMDIIVFSPGGGANIDLAIRSSFFSKLRLEKTNTKVKYKTLKSINKYIRKYKIKHEKIVQEFSTLTYDEKLRRYRIGLKSAKHPVLKKIREYVNGLFLIAVTIIGSLLNSISAVLNIVKDPQNLVTNVIVGILLMGLFILGVVLVWFDL